MDNRSRFAAGRVSLRGSSLIATCRAEKINALFRFRRRPPFQTLRERRRQKHYVEDSCTHPDLIAMLIAEWEFATDAPPEEVRQARRQAGLDPEDGEPPCTRKPKFREQERVIVKRRPLGSRLW